MNKYHIRYNTLHGESDLIWRIFENGQEHLVKDFKISAILYGEKTIENGVVKYNVCCQGNMKIVDGVAFIE